MEKFGLFNKFIAKEGERDRLVNLLLAAANSMEDQDDCELYVVNISPEDANAVYVFEVWNNEKAHQASLSLAAAQALIQQAKPIIAGIERISSLLPKGGKGLTLLN
ncbi:MAG TPA: antibiotic biosynthesis monooxygenase family protein [Neobacillus sp.]